MWRRVVGIVAVSLGLVLTGCANEGAQMTPTGDELYEQAHEQYLRYRAVTNEVQRLIHDGPWEVGQGAYGFEPSGAGCPEEAYKFALTRTVGIDPAEHAERARAVQEYLSDAGYTLDGMELGSGEAASRDVIVRTQGDFSLLMVTFIANGNVLVTATTTCWPGDPDELSEAMFGDVYLGEGYLPREESPSDPLFFGVTPGEPQFLAPPSDG